MKKGTILIGGLAILSLALFFGFFDFAIAEGSGPYEINQTYINVQTSNGTIELPAGAFVDGNPTNYITLTETITLQTTEGEKTFNSGTKVDCNFTPPEPDPCDVS